MGIHLAVKKTPAPSCGSFGSIAAAIASPQYTESDSFSNTTYLNVDSGEYAAVLYDDVGSGSAGFLVNFTAENLDDISAAFSIYTVNSGGSVVTTVNSPDGEIGFGDESLEIPTDAGDFYVVIYNSGGDSCDEFEIHLYEAS